MLNWLLNLIYYFRPASVDKWAANQYRLMELEEYNQLLDELPWSQNEVIEARDLGDWRVALVPPQLIEGRKC